jgi:hypothetical protein
MNVSAQSAPMGVAASRSDPARWSNYLMALAATSILIGILWDISWHVSIGRDTFWTPAHMAIYFGGTLAGCIGGWLAVMHTFFPRPDERGASVEIFGARAPLGAWVALWGAAAMLISAPFDDWWHNAYGLDVKIISPPHTLLGLGMAGVSAGALLLTLARQNRESNGVGSGLFIYVGGIFLTFGSIFIEESTYPNVQHSLICYKMCCWIIPLRLVTMARAGRISWPATRVAAVYMLLVCLLIWILPLFPAQPKLAPIFNPVTHMVPPAFPLLLIVPAIGIDLFLRKVEDNDSGVLRVVRALVVGAIFLVLMLVAQWFFAEFLLSRYAANWFFAGDRYWGYRAFRGSWQHEFWQSTRTGADLPALTFRGLLRCWAIASLMSWIGLLWGGWMRKVKR